MAELTREQLLMSVISGRGPAYLRGVNLSGMDLSSAGWLCEADLRQANLTGANLSKANLRDARLEKANLHGSNLMGTNLYGADLRETKLTAIYAKLATLADANLHSARMVGANLIKANLKGANLENTDLEGANLEGANLEGARLDLANLKMTNLRGANLKGASVSGTILEKTKNEADQDSTCVHGFSGSIHHLQLMDMIQLASLSRSDLLIEVASDKNRGTVHVRSGRISHAQTGNLRGESALFEILHWENGRFETLPLPEDSIRSIDKPVEHLLIEAMRIRDEEHSPQEQAIES